MNPYEHLEAGWSYPYKITNDGKTSSDTYSESIRSSLHLIVSTRKGELFMQPHLGTRLHKLIFMEIDSVFYALAENYLKEDIYEQDIRVENVQIYFKNTTENEEKSQVIIEIYYTEKRTGKEGKINTSFSTEGRYVSND